MVAVGRSDSMIGMIYLVALGQTHGPGECGINLDRHEVLFSPGAGVASTIDAIAADDWGRGRLAGHTRPPNVDGSGLIRGGWPSIGGGSG